MKIEIPHTTDQRIRDTFPLPTHRVDAEGFRVSFASSGSFTKADACAHVAALDYGTPSTADEHASAVKSACADAPEVLARLEVVLGAALALLAGGKTTDTSAAYVDEASQPATATTTAAGSATSPTPVAVTRATMKTAAAALLTDLATISTALTNAKDAL